MILAIGLLMGSVVLQPRLQADDFAFHEASARAAALGGAFTARAEDVSSLFYNPAAIAFLGGIRFKANLTMGQRSLSAAWPTGGPLYRSSPRDIQGALAFSWQPFKRISVAAGFFSPFNFDTDWPEGWSGRTVSLSARVRTAYFRSVLAVEPIRGLALSAGLDIVSSSLLWRHDLLFSLEAEDPSLGVMLESRHFLNGRGTGIVLGALWKIAPGLQIGARYQSRVAVDYAGENMFYIDPNYVYDLSLEPYQDSQVAEDVFSLVYVPQQVAGRQSFPREIACGLALTPLPRFSLTFDVQWDRWSEFGDWVFRSVTENGDLGQASAILQQSSGGTSPDYRVQGVSLVLKDRTKIKAGLEFRPSRYLALRAGFARHQSVTEAADRSPLYPDLDRNIYSFGFGYEGPDFSIWDEDERISDLSFDLFIRYAPAARGVSELSSFEMTYDSTRLTVGVGVGFCF